MQILIDIIKDFDPDKFVRFFRDKNRSFAPRTEGLSQYDDDNFRNVKNLGEIQFAQGEKMLICAFKASQPLSERSSKKAQYEKGKKILKDNNADSGIFIFYDSNSNLRFSLIYAEYLGVRRRFSYFKRLTFFVSPTLTNKTFLQQIGGCDFSNFESIKEAFSVEPVTKQFYGELQYWYFWAMDKIKFPDDYKYSNDPAKDKEIRNATNLIRLITRIIFIRFLTEKGLIPSELFSGEKLGRIVKDFMKGGKTSNFYNAILQNLFFGTLNQKMDERRFTDERGYPANIKEYGVKNLYRYADKFLINKDKVLELFKDIPFLNGGLFDCLDKDDELNKVIYVDGFSRNPAKQTNIPDYLFFQQGGERADLSKYGLGASRPVRGLFEILNSYNFTIDENTPVDQEIALDPELLGKVFENLLASYNPETATTARKATGSYYTPREIVDYMVQESLVMYLANAINNAPQPPLKLRGGEGGVMLPSPLAGEASHNIPSPLVGEGKDEGGFDIVIGNPPYLRIQEIQKTNPEFADRLKKTYESATGSFDIYACFVELAVRLMHEKANISYILPHKFFQAAFGKNLRKIISSKRLLRKIVDFGSSQVFESATTYTCLLFLSNRNERFKFAELKPDTKASDVGEVFDAINSNDIVQTEKVAVALMLNDTVTEKEWHFSAGNAGDILSKLRKQPRTLADVCEKIFVGLQTSADKIYFLEHISDKNGIVTAFSKSLNREIIIETGFVKPLLKGADIHRYSRLEPKIWCIFPYKIKNGKAVLYTQDEIKKNFPLAWEYLLLNREELENREHGKMAHEQFHAYIYPKNLTEFERAKIVTPDIASCCQMTIDEKELYHTTTIYSFVFESTFKESIKYYLALLNSKLLWYFLTTTGSVLRGDFFRFKTNYLMPFPIPKELSSEEQKPFITLVDQILAAKKKDPNADTSALERQIDKMVYALFGLTPEEIEIVEGKGENE